MAAAITRKRRMHLIACRENKAKLIRPTAAETTKYRIGSGKAIATVTYGGIVSHVARMERSAIRTSALADNPGFRFAASGYASFLDIARDNQSGRFISNMASGRISK